MNISILNILKLKISLLNHEGSPSFPALPVYNLAGFIKQFIKNLAVNGIYNKKKIAKMKED